MADIPPRDLKLSISLVPCWEVHRVWPKVEAMLKRATDRSEGRYDIEDLKEKIEKGEVDLWIVFDGDLQVIAANTTTFTEYPQGLFCSGQFIGGSRIDEWQDDMCALIENWARDHGCKAIEFSGRSGWGRLLARNNYREVFRIFQRDLK